MSLWTLPRWSFGRMEKEYPLLAEAKSPSDEEEQNLIARWKTDSNNKEIKETIVRAYVSYVVNLARRYAHGCHHHEWRDFVQEGLIGLFDALPNFDLSKGYKFLTYADHWIRKAIKTAIEERERLVKLPPTWYGKSD